jgi:predicted dehydrogenase
MIGIGIIGTGRHGSRYAKHIVNDCAGLELRAIARRSPSGKDQAAVWGAGWYDDWKDLVTDPGVEAVISAVPPALNTAIAKKCAAAGKPLLIEKPLAINGSEAAEIVAVMKAAGCHLTVGQTLRYNPVIRDLKSRVKALGALHSFTANQRLEPSTLAWQDIRELAGSGVLTQTAIHVFDALRYITGLKIQRVMAAHYLCKSKNLEDMVLVLAEMEGGVVGTIDVSKVGNARSGRYEFICEDGQVHGDQIHSHVDMIRGSCLQRIAEPLPENTILQLLNEWQGYLEGKNQNPVCGEDGLYAVQICDACLRSSREERWIKVG